MIVIGKVAKVMKTFLGSWPVFLSSLKSFIFLGFRQYRAIYSDFYPSSASVWQSLVVTDVFENVTSWLTVPDAAEVMEIPIGRVRRLIEDHHLISVKRDGVQYIPAEIVVDKEPLASLHGTIVVLLDSGFDLDGAIRWLYTVNDVLGQTPMAALVAGKKSEIRRLAQALAL